MDYSVEWASLRVVWKCNETAFTTPKGQTYLRHMVHCVTAKITWQGMYVCILYVGSAICFSSSEYRREFVSVWKCVSHDLLHHLALKTWLIRHSGVETLFGFICSTRTFWVADKQAQLSEHDMNTVKKALVVCSENNIAVRAVTSQIFGAFREQLKKNCMIVSICLIHGIKWQKWHTEHKEVKFCEKKMLKEKNGH